MRLGLSLGYRDAGRDADLLALVQTAERLEFTVVWAAEAYGSDAATVLGWLAAGTTRIHLGSAVFQIPARTPALTAMTAATLDGLSGGRFRLGLGVSGPQVSEGWHGVRFDAPLARTREYVGVVRQALAGGRVSSPGPHYPLPLPGGAGKALRLTAHPVRDRLPIYLAALGPRNLELAGEIADGWLGLFFDPARAADSLTRLAAGRERAGRPASLAGFDRVVSAPLVVDDDLARAADRLRPHAALYLGGMGSRAANFYNAALRRAGHPAAADQVQQAYLAGDRAAAAAAVPSDYLTATALVGPPDRLVERMQAYADAGVTTLSVQPFGDTPAEREAALRTAAEVLEKAGVGG